MQGDPSLSDLLQQMVDAAIAAERKGGQGGSTMVVVFLSYLSVAVTILGAIFRPKIAAAVEFLKRITKSLNEESAFRRDARVFFQTTANREARSLEALDMAAQKDAMILKALDEAAHRDKKQCERDEQIMLTLKSISERFANLELRVERLER